MLDGVLIAQAGVAFRDSYLEGKENPADPRVVEALNTVVKMLDYTNSNRDELAWDGAAQLVVAPEVSVGTKGDGIASARRLVRTARGRAKFLPRRSWGSCDRRRIRTSERDSPDRTLDRRRKDRARPGQRWRYSD